MSRTAHSVAAVRAAEAALAAGLPDGTLMQRAATGLARACAGLLGRVYGSRVVLLVGSGDNGGDAHCSPGPSSPGAAPVSKRCCWIRSGRTPPAWRPCGGPADAWSPTRT